MSNLLYQELSHLHKYLNVALLNNSSLPKTIDGRIQRSDNIVNHPDEFLLSLDRYSLYRALLPVYKTSGRNVSFSMEAGGTIYSGNVAFSSEFYFSLHDLLDDFNDALTNIMNDLNTGEGTVYNAPVFSFAENLWSLTTDSAFRSNVKLYFGAESYCLFNTFEFKGFDFGNALLFAQMILSKDTEVQRQKTLEVFLPIAKLLLKSDMPVLEEATPDYNSASNQSKSTDTILTDYVITPSDSSNLFNIEFSAQGNHRYMSMSNQDNFSSFSINAFWQDREGNQYPLLVAGGGYLDMKFQFVNDTSSYVGLTED